jgi:hypothetical protein
MNIEISPEGTDSLPELPNEGLLYKIKTRSPKKIVFIGNGCVTEGWKVFNEVSFDTPYANDPELGLAIAAESFRSGLHLVMMHYSEYFSRPLSSLVKDLDENLTEFRHNIAAAFSKASEKGFFGSAKTPYKLSLSDKLLKTIGEKDTLVVTTNWDKLLWMLLEEGKIHNLIQLHGVCFESPTLLLPTELLKDSGTFWLLYGDKLNHDPDVDNSRLLGIKKRSENIGFAASILESCFSADSLQEVVIAGINLNTYDSELIWHLTAFRETVKKGSRQILKQLTIVNPDKKAAERIKNTTFDAFKQVIWEIPIRSSQAIFRAE